MKKVVWRAQNHLPRASWSSCSGLWWSIESTVCTYSYQSSWCYDIFPPVQFLHPDEGPEDASQRTPKTPLLKYYNCYTWRLKLHDWVAVLIKYLPFSVWSHHPSHNYYCQIFQKCLVWLYVCRLFSPLHIHILRAKKAIPRNVCGECYFKYFTQWKPTIITRRRCEGDGCKGGGGY